MIYLKGYNKKLGETVYLSISSDGTFLGEEKWNHLENGSVKRYTGQQDRKGNLLSEDEWIVKEETGEEFVICYGMFEFQMKERTMKTVGFYLETSDFQTLPFANAEQFRKQEDENKS